ncbi:hypothetical protein QE152_g9063 [Popillia japonica]|uniref:Uncharacterized protein n=1 Tax=Popillia japonica TaxID=7064 RepID=A0AAW1LZY6_POPJA
MMLKLINFDLCLKYIPGKDLHIADLLSRNYLNEEHQDEIGITGIVHAVNRFSEKANKNLDIKKEAYKDPQLKEVQQYTLTRWPKNKGKITADVQ